METTVPKISGFLMGDENTGCYFLNKKDLKKIVI